MTSLALDLKRQTQEPPNWRFLTNHGLVLLHISRDPQSTGLQIAQAAGITERAARRILNDLENSGYIEREKLGRRNQYRVDVHRPLTRIGDRLLTVGQLLKLLSVGQDATTAD